MLDPAPPIETYWVVPGKLLAGEYPGTRLIYGSMLSSKLGYLLERKITYFLDLTESGALTPYSETLFQEAERLGHIVEYHRFPIPDFGIPTRAQMNGLLDMLDAALEAGQVVYVHCWSGIGRTGTLVGCFLVRHGLTGEQALARLVELRRCLTDAWRRSPESDEQLQMVMEWDGNRSPDF